MMFGEFGTALRNYRQERTLTLKQVSELSGVSVAFVSALERGKKSPPLSFIERVSKGMSLTTEELDELRRAADHGFTEVRLPLQGRSNRTKELVMAFARRFDSLPEQELDRALRKVLRK